MRLIILTALAAWLSGCLAPPPEKLELRVHSLHRTLRACGDTICRDAVRSDLLDLAQRAAEASDAERDSPTRMALLRVAGISAWQAGEIGESLAAQIATAALPSCRTLDDLARDGHPVGAPDDCVVLESLPALIAHAGFRRSLAELQVAPADEAGALQLRDAVNRYPDETFLTLRAIEARLRSYTGVSDEILAWQRRTEMQLFCSMPLAGLLAESRWPGNDSLRSALATELEYGSTKSERDYADCEPPAPLALPPTTPSTTNSHTTTPARL